MIPDLAAWGMAGAALASICAASAFVIKVSIGIGRHLKESEHNTEMIQMIPGIRDELKETKSIAHGLSAKVAKHDSQISELMRGASFAEGIEEGLRQSRGDYG